VPKPGARAFRWKASHSPSQGSSTAHTCLAVHSHCSNLCRTRRSLHVLMDLVLWPSLLLLTPGGPGCCCLPQRCCWCGASMAPSSWASSSPVSPVEGGGIGNRAKVGVGVWGHMSIRRLRWASPSKQGRARGLGQGDGWHRVPGGCIAAVAASDQSWGCLYAHSCMCPCLQCTSVGRVSAPGGYHWCDSCTIEHLCMKHRPTHQHVHTSAAD
jgi:hypothetical protein